MNKKIKDILKENVFPKEIIVKFKTSKGEVVKVPATKGTVYYEKKDVLKVIRILKKQSEDLQTKKWKTKSI